jgi:hypothetical protein
VCDQFTQPEKRSPKIIPEIKINIMVFFKDFFVLKFAETIREIFGVAVN